MAYKNPKDIRRAPAGGILGVWERFVMFMRGWLPAWEPSILITIEEGAGCAAERLTVEKALRRRYLPSGEILNLNGRIRRWMILLFAALMLLPSIAMAIFDRQGDFLTVIVCSVIILLGSVFGLVFASEARPDIQKLNYDGSVTEESYRLSGRIMPHIYAGAEHRFPRFEIVTSFVAVRRMLDLAQQHDGDDSIRVDYLRLILAKAKVA